MIDQDKHIGKQLLRVSISIGFSPAIEAIADPSVDAREIGAKLKQAIQKTIAGVLGDYEWTLPGQDLPRIEVSGQLIKTKEERDADREAAFARMAKPLQDADKAREKEIDNNPDNGKHGVWHVDGIRHDCRVIASSAREAVDKAIAAEAVGDWESPTASYVGPVESLDVF